MLESYFFIPGDKISFLEKTKRIQSDFYVFDLEDSVSKKNKPVAFNQLMRMTINENTFVRIPFIDDSFSLQQKSQLINHFKGRIVIPKIKKPIDFTRIINQHDIKYDLKTILLVETPECLIQLNEILSKHSNNIKAVGFGSHDFCNIMEIKHELKNLIHYKKDLILKAKAFGKSYIDSVDLNLKDFSDFEAECLWSFQNGANGKFLIHPRQLDKLKEVEFLSEKERQKITRVYHKIKSLSLDEIDILKIEDEVYEMPHIQKIINLHERMTK